MIREKMKNNMLRPYLSIIVPIYNTEKYLKKCIESILQQTYEDYELILVDDGSTDKSLSICNHYAGQDDRIYVIHKKNEGVMSARKAGLNFAHGEYISFIDSDDWIEADFYSLFLEGCQDIRPDMLFANGYIREKFSDEETQQERIYISLKNGMYHRKGIEQILKKKKIIPALWLKLFKRDLIKQNIFLVDNRICIGEDELCTYACILDADSIIIKNNLQYHYVQRQSSAMHRRDKKNVEGVVYFARSVKKIRRIKKAGFIDSQWNRMILTILLNAVLKEYEKYSCILGKKELDEIERMFAGLELEHLLIKHEYKTGIHEKKVGERLILYLYSLKCYRLLGLWVKIYIALFCR